MIESHRYWKAMVEMDGVEVKGRRFVLISNEIASLMIEKLKREIQWKRPGRPPPGIAQSEKGFVATGNSNHSMSIGLTQTSAVMIYGGFKRVHPCIPAYLWYDIHLNLSCLFVLNLPASLLVLPRWQNPQCVRQHW